MNAIGPKSPLYMVFRVHWFNYVPFVVCSYTVSVGPSLKLHTKARFIRRLTTTSVTQQKCRRTHFYRSVHLYVCDEGSVVSMARRQTAEDMVEPGIDFPWQWFSVFHLAVQWMLHDKVWLSRQHKILQVHNKFRTALFFNWRCVICVIWHLSQGCVTKDKSGSVALRVKKGFFHKAISQMMGRVTVELRIGGRGGVKYRGSCGVYFLDFSSRTMTWIKAVLSVQLS